MRIFTFCTLLLSLVISAAHAGIIKGKVTDLKGSPLPYATIYAEGTTIGTNTNADGMYELNLMPGSYRILCQYVGFKQDAYSVAVKGDETITHPFKLSDQSLQMKEVTVHASAEDPAYGIIREAIKKRKFHLHQVESFQTSLYFKGVAHSRFLPKQIMGKKITAEDLGVADTSGRGVIFLSEEDADYYAEGGKDRTVIHSVHTSGDPNGLGFSRFPPVISFYDNIVNVFGKGSRGYISPISDNALNYYKYKLEGEFMEQDRRIFKIKVTNKREFEPCFNGTIYIVNDDWAIHSTDLTLTKQTGLDFMDTLKLRQVLVPLAEDQWVIKSQVIYFTVNFLGLDITASGVSVYNNQKVNQPVPDSMFADRVVSSYDKVANKRDSSYWTASRPIPLEKDETTDFVVKDSIRKVEEDPKRIDSIRQKGNKFKPVKFALSGYTYSTEKYKNVYSTNSLLLGFGAINMINYNIVEGLNIAPKVHIRHFIDTGKYLHADVAARYGFSNRHFNAIGRLYYQLDNRAWINRRWIFGAEGGKYVFQFNPENPVSEWFNTYAALLYRQNDLKIYERYDASAFVMRNYGNGLTWEFKASYQQRLPLTNSTYYSFFAGPQFSDNMVPNLLKQATAWEKHDAVLLHGSVSYQPGFTYTQYPDFKYGSRSAWPTMTLSYDKGVPDILNSKVDYDKWRFNIRDDVHLRLAGIFSYNFVAGGFLNTNYVSIPDLMHLYGNRGIGYAAPYLQSFQFAHYYDFSNKDALYGEAHIEYHMNGLLSNKIPGLKQAHLYLVAGGNAFYAHTNEYYTEAFLGLENIGYKAFRILRVDFVQSWDSNMGHNSGIRFGLNTSAFSGNSSPVHGEW